MHTLVIFEEWIFTVITLHYAVIILQMLRHIGWWRAIMSELIKVKCVLYWPLHSHVLYVAVTSRPGAVIVPSKWNTNSSPGRHTQLSFNYEAHKRSGFFLYVGNGWSPVQLPRPFGGLVSDFGDGIEADRSKSRTILVVWQHTSPLSTCVRSSLTKRVEN